MAKTFADYENSAQARVVAAFETMLEALDSVRAGDLPDKIDELKEQWTAVQEVVDEVVDVAFDAGKEEGIEEASE